MNKTFEIERRFIDPEVVDFRAESEGMVVVGRPIIYEKETILFPGVAEIIHRGAATEALSLNEAYLLWQHDQRQPMASYRNGTLSHIEDEEGVQITADCSKTSWGRDGFEAVRNGIITKMSFAFRALKVEWEERKNTDGSILDVRHIVKFEHIFDFAPVTFPAYNDTEIVKRALTVPERSRREAPPTFNPYAAAARNRRLRLSGYQL